MTIFNLKISEARAGGGIKFYEVKVYPPSEGRRSELSTIFFFFDLRFTMFNPMGEKLNVHVMLLPHLFYVCLKCTSFVQSRKRQRTKPDLITGRSADAKRATEQIPQNKS